MLNYLSYGIKIWTDFSSVLLQYTRVTDRRTDGQTDGRTDRILLATPRLHYMQRGKNEKKHNSINIYETNISIHARAAHDSWQLS